MRWLALALALAALPGCPNPALSAPCPGQPVGTFQFAGVPAPSDGGTCYFAGDGGSAFAAEVSFGSGDAAYLCPQRADATPFQGTHAGDHLVASTMFPPNDASGCNCLVVVTETVAGDLVRASGPGTPVTGFDGGLEVDVVPAPDAGPCEPASTVPDAGPSCGVPCQVVMSLSGS